MLENLVDMTNPIHRISRVQQITSRLNRATGLRCGRLRSSGRVPETGNRAMSHSGGCRRGKLGLAAMSGYATRVGSCARAGLPIWPQANAEPTRRGRFLPDPCALYVPFRLAPQTAPDPPLCGGQTADADFSKRSAGFSSVRGGHSGRQYWEPQTGPPASGRQATD